MDNEEKSFEELVKESPLGARLSLVGALARSSEAGKFVLTLQDGRAMTMETASVKGHTVLGTSVGHTIVRIDVDAGSIPASVPSTSPTVADIYTPPGVDHTLAWLDHGPKPFWQDAPSPNQYAFGSLAPFSLATPHQAPVNSLGPMQGLSNAASSAFWSRFFEGTYYGYDQPKPSGVDGKAVHDGGGLGTATGAWPDFD